MRYIEPPKLGRMRDRINVCMLKIGSNIPSPNDLLMYSVFECYAYIQATEFTKMNGQTNVGITFEPLDHYIVLRRPRDVFITNEHVIVNKKFNSLRMFNVLGTLDVYSNDRFVALSAKLVRDINTNTDNAVQNTSSIPNIEDQFVG